MALDTRTLLLLREIDLGGSLSAAARAIGYSQSAASQQLRSAERELGARLVDRQTGGSTLTAAGRALADAAEPIVNRVRQAVSDARLIGQDGTSTIRVAAFSSAANALLPSAFTAARAVSPAQHFTLREGETEACLDLLDSGEADLAIVYAWPLPPSREADAAAFPRLRNGRFAITPICSERAWIALPSGQASAQIPSAPVALDGSRPVGLNDLRDAPWIAGCPICRRSLVDACQDSGFTPRIDFETDDYHAVLALVESGMGCALVTDLMLASAVPHAGIRFVPCQPARYRSVVAVASRAAAATTGLRTFVSQLHTAGASLTGTSTATPSRAR